MRYFRYKNTDKNFNNALKEQYKTLTTDEKRIFRKKKTWQKFSMIVFFMILCACMGLGVFILHSIKLPGAWYVQIPGLLGKVVFAFIWLVGSFVLTVLLTKPLWEKVESFRIPAMKKEIFARACEHLRKYYRLEEPYIITKCFDATDRKFINHDVCIFITDDELRITANLVRGFLDGKRDLGCYAFKRNEITVTRLKDGKQLITLLQAGDTQFQLGCRAKGFIERRFLSRPEDQI